MPRVGSGQARVAGGDRVWFSVEHVLPAVFLRGQARIALLGSLLEMGVYTGLVLAKEVRAEGTLAFFPMFCLPVRMNGTPQAGQLGEPGPQSGANGAHSPLTAARWGRGIREE